MFRKKEKGVSLINYILTFFIFCALGVIYLMLSSDSSITEIAQVNEILNILPTNIINQDKRISDLDKNITLSSDILTDNPASSPNIDNQSETSTQTIPNFNYYFYNQLKENEKRMYGVIVNNIQSFKNGSDKIEIANSKEEVDFQFQSCWDAFCLDRPDIFYIDTKKVSFITQTTSSVLNGTKYKYILQPQNNGTYYLRSWSNKSEIELAIREVENVANEVIEKVSNYTERYDKVKGIHDFIIENAEYDKNQGINDADIYGNLVKKTSVCEGYAKAFKYILDKMDIPCVIVCGNGIADDGHSEFHAWNYVQMDDEKWYAVDCTWDDPIVIGNGTLSEKTKHKYCLVGSNSFSSSHQEDGDVSGTGQNFKYPPLSQTDYR